jgi:hypothetical protein
MKTKAMLMGLLFALSAGTAGAQYTAHYSWAKGFGQASTNNVETGNSICSDGTYTYSTGKFKGTMTSNSFSITSTETSPGSGVYTWDIYVLKVDANGLCQGLAKAGGTSDDEGFGITYMSSNVYITGNKGTDIYFVKFNTGLTFQTDRTVTPGGADGVGRGITNDGTFIYATGYYTDNADFGSGTTRNKQNPPGTGTGRDMFLVKYNTSFTEQAFGNMYDSNSDDNEGYAIAYYSSKLYLTGYFKGTVKFTSTSSASFAAGGTRDVFVTSATTSCVFNTDEKRGGSAYSETVNHYDYEKEIGRGIAVNSNGIFVTGTIKKNSANNDCTFGSFSLTGGTNGYGAFFIKYSLDGSNKVSTESWAYDTGWLSGSETLCGGFCAAIDGTDIYFGGYARSSIQFKGASSGTVNLNNLNNATDVGFICKYDNSGNINWADEVDQRAPSGNSNGCFGLYASGCDLFATGQYAGPCYFGDISTSVSAIGTGGSDVFVAKAAGKFWMTQNVTQCGTFNIAVGLSVNPSFSTYAWTPTTYLGGGGSSQNPTHTMTGCGDASVTNYTVVTTGTCADTGYVTVTTSRTAAANAGAATGGCDLYTGPLGATGNYTTGTSCAGWKYSWAPATYLNSTTLANPTATLVTATTTYTLTVTDVCGGTATATQKITIVHGCRVIGNETENAYDDPTLVFPNPSTGIVSITPGLGIPYETYDLEIVDVTGNLVYEEKNIGRTDTHDLDLRSLAKGIYILQMNRNDSKIIYKLVLE